MQTTNDPNTKVYNTRYELTERVESGTKHDQTDLGDLAKIFFKEVRGVVQVQMAAYAVMITKAPLFDWVEIDCGVQGILRMFVASQKQLKNLDVEPIHTVSGPPSTGAQVS